MILVQKGEARKHPIDELINKTNSSLKKRLRPTVIFAHANDTKGCRDAMGRRLVGHF